MKRKRVGKKKTILIVDDHPLFREGLKSLIGGNMKFELTGEAGSAKEGLRMAKKLKPDLVLIDLTLPDRSGIDLTRDIRSLLPQTRIMIVSVHSGIHHVTEALRVGASGYIVKESAGDRLMRGLEAVAKGDNFLDSSMSSIVAKRLLELPAREAEITDARYKRLTQREQQVLRLLAEGLSTKEVAERLVVSPKTIENHRANIMHKLDLHSTMELLRYAVRLGLIDVDIWKD